MNRKESNGMFGPANLLPDQEEVDVFISYSEGDENYVEEIVYAIEELNRCLGLGITYYTDVNSVHTSSSCSGLCAKIAHLIESCKVYIHVGNQHANNDSYAFRKAHHAVDVSDRNRNEEQPPKALLTLLDGDPQSVLPSAFMFLLSNINHRQKSCGVCPVLVKDITRRLGYELPVNPKNRYTVFVSYSHMDQSCVKRLSKSFDEYIVEYFMYENDISGGENYMEEISSAIDVCQVFLFAGSAASYASKYTLKELYYAVQKKNLSDIYVCDIDGSGTPLPPAVSLLLSGKTPIPFNSVVHSIKPHLPSSSMAYKYGSVYDFGKAKGIVFLSGGGPGDLGRAIGVEEKSLPWCLDSTLFDSVDFSAYPYYDDDLDGYDKRRAFRCMPMYHETYPAAGYCAKLEDKWYLPKLTELIAYCDYFDKINNILLEKGYEPLKLDQMYWSVTEKEDVDGTYPFDPHYAYGCIFRRDAWGGVKYEIKRCLKTEKGLVRPFLFFGL